MKELIYKLLDIASLGRGLKRKINGHSFASRVTGSKGKVYVFEPAPSAYSPLQKTLAINNNNGLIETFQKEPIHGIGLYISRFRRIMQGK